MPANTGLVTAVVLGEAGAADSPYLLCHNVPHWIRGWDSVCVCVCEIVIERGGDH